MACHGHLCLGTPTAIVRTWCDFSVLPLALAFSSPIASLNSRLHKSAAIRSGWGNAAHHNNFWKRKEGQSSRPPSDKKADFLAIAKAFSKKAAGRFVAQIWRPNIVCIHVPCGHLISKRGHVSELKPLVSRWGKYQIPKDFNQSLCLDISYISYISYLARCCNNPLLGAAGPWPSL